MLKLPCIVKRTVCGKIVVAFIKCLAVKSTINSPSGRPNESTNYLICAGVHILYEKDNVNAYILSSTAI